MRGFFIDTSAIYFFWGQVLTLWNLIFYTKLFLDLRGAIIGGVVNPDKISKHVINSTVTTTFNTLKSAVTKLKKHKCPNDL